MAEIDPDKILAEFEIARLQIRKKEKTAFTGIPKEGRGLAIGLVVVLGFAALALWVLMMILEQMPHSTHHPEGNHGAIGQVQK